jgi:hypothetical protein
VKRCIRSGIGFVTLLAGCGGGGEMMMVPDAAVLPDLAPQSDLTMIDPKAHPIGPLVDNNGGKVLAAPEVWTVVWPGDETTGATVDGFHAAMLGSKYWTDALTQYGVGAGVAKGVIVLSTAAPATITDDALESIVKMLTMQPMYAADANTLFAMVIPKTTTVDDGTGDVSCVDYDGYHSSTSSRVAYSVVLNCTGALDDLTQTDSHETAESASDPYPNHLAAWASNDFYAVSGGEIADLCDPLTATLTAQSTSYSVVRLYSNAAAMAGTDPCLPVPADPPYFGAALDPSLMVINRGQDGTGSITVGLDLFALGPVGTISWFAENLPQGLKVIPSQGSGVAGDRVTLTIHASGVAFQGENAFDLRVSSSKGGDNEWWGVVTIN